MLRSNIYIFIIAVVFSVGFNLVYQIAAGSQPHYLLDFLFFGIGVVIAQVIFHLRKRKSTSVNN